MKEALLVILVGGVLLVSPLFWILTRDKDKKSKYLKIYCCILFTPILAGLLFSVFYKEPNKPDINNYPSSITTKTPEYRVVQNRIIFIGMSENELLIKWGKADKINSLTNAYGINEQWIYGEHVPVYINLENHVVTSWQESK